MKTVHVPDEVHQIAKLIAVSEGIDIRQIVMEGIILRAENSGASPTAQIRKAIRKLKPAEETAA